MNRPDDAPSPQARPGAAQRVFLVGDKTSLRDLGRIARAVVDDVRIVATPDEVAADDADLVVVDYEAIEEGARDAIFERFARQQDAGRFVLFMGGAQRTELAGLFARHTLTHLLARSGDLDGDELLVTVQKILRDDIFGLEKYFPWGAEHERLTLSRASDRFAAIRAAAAFATRKGAQARFVELFQSAADELITNAIYNAPTNDAGERCFAHLSRTEEVELAAGKSVEAVFCTDGRKLGISVRDPFGSLATETVVAYLGKCFRKGSDQVDDKEGGAGLGLYYLFETLSQFIINVHPGRRTELIGVIDIRGRYRDFSERPKSFNVFLAR